MTKLEETVGQYNDAVIFGEDNNDVIPTNDRAKLAKERFKNKEFVKSKIDEAKKSISKPGPKPKSSSSKKIEKPVEQTQEPVYGEFQGRSTYNAEQQQQEEVNRTKQSRINVNGDGSIEPSFKREDPVSPWGATKKMRCKMELKDSSISIVINTYYQNKYSISIIVPVNDDSVIFYPNIGSDITLSIGDNVFNVFYAGIEFVIDELGVMIMSFTKQANP